MAGTVQVIEVDLGSTVPGISNLRALPCPTANIWPQAIFDLDYGGECDLTRLMAARFNSTSVLHRVPLPLISLN